MGYCYTNTGSLVCDGCGQSGGVRKRKCPHKVTCADIFDGKLRHTTLPFCIPAALCNDCFDKEGKNEIHDGCKKLAEQSQARNNLHSKYWTNGFQKRSSAFGDWHKNVPEGMVGVKFVGIHRESWWLIPKDRYNQHEWLHEFATKDLTEWSGP